MQNVVENLGWKKIAAILIVLGAIFLIVSVVSTVNTVQGPSVKSKKTPLDSNSKSFQNNQGNTAVKQQWQTYANPDFKISYPPTLSAEKGIIPGGGNSLFLKDKDRKLRINIQSYSPNVASISGIMNVFSNMDYKQEVIMFGKFSGYKLTGLASGNGVILRGVAIVFENKGITFKLQLAYESPNQNPQIEKEFGDIISTFNLE